MEKWLLEIGDKYVNKTNFNMACMILFAIQGLLLFVVFRALRIGGILGDLSDLIWTISLSGQLLQLIQEICIAFLFLGLMISVYRKGYKMPLIGILLIISFCTGVLTFVVNNTGGQRGPLFFLSSIIISILQIIVGFQLFKTDFRILGKFILAFPIVMFLSILLFGTSPIVMFIAIANVVALTYAFYTFLLSNF